MKRAEQNLGAFFFDTGFAGLGLAHLRHRGAILT
jgi:hypothetical protein